MTKLKPKRRPTKADNTRHTEDLNRYLERRGPGAEAHAPTPERVRHANLTIDGEVGQQIRANIIHTEAGFPTGEFYWRITPVIDELERRRTLTPEEWAVACRYMRHYAGSRHKGPATSKFLPYYDRGFQEFSPPERAVAFGQAVALAKKAMPPLFHPMLTWLEKCAEDEWPLWKLGEIYYPDMSRSTQSAKAPQVLQFGLALLAHHYGMSHRFSVVDIETVVRRMRVTVEIEERYLS